MIEQTTSIQEKNHLVIEGKSEWMQDQDLAQSIENLIEFVDMEVGPKP